MPLQTAEEVLAAIPAPRKAKKAKAVKPEIVVVSVASKWTDLGKIKTALSKLDFKAVKYIITGTGAGDLLCVRACKMLGLPVIQVHLNSAYSGSSAYYMRNNGVFTFFKPTRVIAFHKTIAESLSTAMYLKLGRKKEIPCQLIDGKSKKPTSKP